ncbi:hypothetical protein LP416_02475 [Polaromonas sp. P2-4]|nr:hypothetical protein LP416_02475 [Polaromonas sp. P2-4]
MAQQFAHRTGDEFRCLLQALPLIRMTQQRLLAIAEQVARRLVPTMRAAKERG